MPPPRDLLIFTEGEATEPEYLTRWYRLNRERIRAQVDRRHGVPTTLVNLAVDTRNTELRLARRGGGRPHDEIWVVFDADDHPGLRAAIDEARREGIKVAFSNPCIELWFILHFQDQAGFIERHDAQRMSRALLGSGKHLSPAALEELVARVGAAEERAHRLDVKHELDGSPGGSNPSSGVWRLVRSMRGD